MFFRCLISLDGSLFLFGILFIEFFLLLAAVQKSPKKLSRKAYKNIQAKRADGYKRPSMFNTNCKKHKIYAKESMGSNVSEF